MLRVIKTYVLRTFSHFLLADFILTSTVSLRSHFLMDFFFLFLRLSSRTLAVNGWQRCNEKNNNTRFAATIIGTTQKKKKNETESDLDSLRAHVMIYLFWGVYDVHDMRRNFSARWRLFVFSGVNRRLVHPGLAFVHTNSNQTIGRKCTIYFTIFFQPCDCKVEEFICINSSDNFKMTLTKRIPPLWVRSMQLYSASGDINWMRSDVNATKWNENHNFRIMKIGGECVNARAIANYREHGKNMAFINCADGKGNVSSVEVLVEIEWLAPTVNSARCTFDAI